jgi:SnoaL-like domain
MDAMSVVEAWDRSLRASDWEAARTLLADDATYLGSEDLEADFNCQNADQIVDLMRSWKGQLPDVEVVEWETVGHSVVARLRQPAWGEDADWYQVLSVEDDLITRLEDFPTSDSAFAAAG